MNKQIYFIILLFSLFTYSCKTDEITYYEDTDALSLYVGRYEADSISYNFFFSNDVIEEDTVFVKVRVQGRVTDIDRPVQLTMTEGTTALEGIDFKLPVVYLPAGEVELLYPVILFRTSSLASTMKSLVVSIKENDYFKQAGLGQEPINLSYSIPSYKINFNDFVSQPDYWSTISSFVGEFSVRKFLFMIQEYNRTDFKTTSRGGTFPLGDYYNMTNRLSNALVIYESVHGTLYDENNNRVTFP